MPKNEHGLRQRHNVWQRLKKPLLRLKPNAVPLLMHVRQPRRRPDAKLRNKRCATLWLTEHSPYWARQSQPVQCSHSLAVV